MDRSESLAAAKPAAISLYPQHKAFVKTRAKKLGLNSSQYVRRLLDVDAAHDVMQSNLARTAPPLQTSPTPKNQDQ